jgi:hypothetical protein
MNHSSQNILVLRMRGLQPFKGNVDLIAERLRTAERDHEEHDGKEKR